MNGSSWKELKDELNVFVIWAVSSLIDAAFLALWVFVQWLNDKVSKNLELSGIDQFVLFTFQVLFAIATLAPVIIYIYVDVRVMIIRAQRKIQRERALGQVTPDE